MNKKKKNVPKYIYIKDDLINRINDSEYNEGDFLPTEESLSELYGVSRITIRKALDELTKYGYIKKNRGSGSIVINKKGQIKSPYLKSFTEEMEEKHKEIETKVMSFKIIKASEEISKLIDVAVDSQVYLIERLRIASGIPMIFVRSYMEVEKNKDLTLQDLEKSKFEYAKRKGYDIDCSIQNIDAIAANDFIAKVLNIELGTPLIKSRNLIWLKDNTIFDYSEVYMNPHEYQLVVVKE